MEAQVQEPVICRKQRNGGQPGVQGMRPAVLFSGFVPAMSGEQYTSIKHKYLLGRIEALRQKSNKVMFRASQRISQVADAIEAERIQLQIGKRRLELEEVCTKRKICKCFRPIELPNNPKSKGFRER